MTQIVFVGFAVLTIALTGCEKAKMRPVPRTPENNRFQSAQLPPPSQRGPIARGDERLETRQGGVTAQAPRPAQEPSPVRPSEPVLPSAPSNNEDTSARPGSAEVEAPRRPEPNVRQPVNPTPPAENLNPAPTPTQVVRPETPPPAENCVGREGEACKPPEAVKGQCQAIPLRVDKETKRSKPLDILIVVDTSASLRGGRGRVGELEQLAKEMEHLVEQIPEADFSIGVMLGHGPASQWHGKLFTNNDAAVLNFSQFYTREKAKGGSEEQIVARAKKAISDVLAKKMRAVPNEARGAQGEALMLSLYKGLMDDQLRKRMREQGLFRNGAALNVMFLTDEQDVCHDYEDSNKRLGTNYQPVKVKKQIRDRRGRVIRTEEGRDPIETEFFEKVCKVAVQGQPLRPAHVYDALKRLMAGMGDTEGKRLILTGIGYRNPETVKAVGPQDENELAHGILELVENLGTGRVEDMANIERAANGNVSFKKELRSLGDFIKLEMTYASKFGCTSNIHPLAINPTSVELTITLRGEAIAKFSGRCNRAAQTCEGVTGGLDVEIRKGMENRPYMQVVLNEAAIAKLVKDHGFERATERAANGRERAVAKDVMVNIEFFTIADKDPRTGEARRR